MRLISILISLSFLRRSFGVQDEFLSLKNSNPIRRESLADDGCNQNIDSSHLQGFSSSESPSSFNLVSPIRQAGDYLRQPTTPTYPLETVATLPGHARPPSSNHVSSDLSQGPFYQAPGSPSRPGLQHPTSSSDEPANHAIPHANSQSMPSHNGISDVSFDDIASYLIDEGPSDPPLLYNTSPLDESIPNLASASNSFSDLAPLSWTQIFRGLQHEPHGGAQVQSPTLGSAAGSSHIATPDNEPDQVVSDSIPDFQSSDSTQNSPTASKKRKIASGVAFDAAVEANRKAQRLTPTSKSIKMTAEIPHEWADISDRRRARPRQRTQITSEEIPNRDDSDLAWMTHLAPKLQDDRDQRTIVIEKTVTKWLPVYKKLYGFRSTNCEIKTKLAILFEHLWHVNTWLLHSFEFEILDNDVELVHCGNDHMMNWVVHEMLHSKGASLVPGRTLNFSSMISQKGDLEKHIFNFLAAERQTEGLLIIKRRDKYAEVKKENFLACELAVAILEAYYKSTNMEKYMEVFKDWNPTQRLLAYTNVRKNQNQSKWDGRKESIYGTVILPWSQIEFSTDKELARDNWDTSLQDQFKQIVSERLEELDEQRLKQKKSGNLWKFKIQRSLSGKKHADSAH